MEFWRVVAVSAPVVWRQSCIALAIIYIMDKSSKSRERLEAERRNPWMRAERYSDCLFDAILTSDSDGERGLFVSFLLAYFDWILNNSDPLPAEFDYTRGGFGAFIFVKKALKDPACRDLVWDWMRLLLKRARENYSYQDAIVVGVFSLIAEDPLKLCDAVEAELVHRFLKSYEDIGTRWVVYAAYKLWPRKLEEDLLEHTKWCQQHGLLPVEFDHAEVRNWITENRTDEEDTPDRE